MRLPGNSPLLPLLAVAMLVLAACESPPPPMPTYPEIRFDRQPVLRLDVKEIVVKGAYQPPLTRPNIEHLFPIPPAAAAQAWADDRLRAVGTRGRARLIIKDASVISEPLPLTKGLGGVVESLEGEGGSRFGFEAVGGHGREA